MCRKRGRDVTMTRVARAGLVSALVVSFLSIDVGAVRLAHVKTEVPATNPLTGNEAAIREGRSWFRAAFALCHGIHADVAGRRRYGGDLRGDKLLISDYVEIVTKYHSLTGG